MKYFRLLLLCALSACSAITPPCPPPVSGDIVYVIGAGWHAEIGIPVDQLKDGLEYYKDVYPGARVILFGYGKKTFFTAPARTFSEYILGPFPGPAVIHTVGLRVTPPEAYPDENVMTLALPPGGNAALADFIWSDLVKDNMGIPSVVGPSTNPDGMFYDTASQYNLAHTCNTWTAEALKAAGLSVSSGDVAFAYQVMSRAHEVAASQCPLR